MVVLISDAYFGCIRTRSIKDGLTESPVTLHNPGWRKAVQGMGIHAVKLSTEAELRDTISHWNSSAGPLFIEISFDPDRYQEMVRDIR